MTLIILNDAYYLEWCSHVPRMMSDIFTTSPWALVAVLRCEVRFDNAKIAIQENKAQAARRWCAGAVSMGEMSEDPQCITCGIRILEFQRKLNCNFFRNKNMLIFCRSNVVDNCRSSLSTWAPVVRRVASTLQWMVPDGSWLLGQAIGAALRVVGRRAGQWCCHGFGSWLSWWWCLVMVNKSLISS